MFGYSGSQPLIREAAPQLRTVATHIPAAGRARQANPRALGWAERACALALLALLSPLFLGAALIIRWLSGRCPLIAHARVGHRGRPIWMLKFRTMWGGAGAVRKGLLVERIEGEPVPRTKGRDQRVTSGFAALCRKYSIDELPQLWHVVTGEMSLVGPRPITGDELEQWYGEHAREILQWKPGMTGLWQVRGRDSLSYRRRCRLDLFFVRNWSPTLYLRILFATIPGVITGRNAN